MVWCERVIYGCEKTPAGKNPEGKNPAGKTPASKTLRGKLKGKPLLPVRLGVNVDHVATLRNARGGVHPDPVLAAQIASKAGAQGITAHLREDRRHIKDRDLFRLKKECKLPLNMEMAVTKEMIAIAKKLRPKACLLVPEKREEITTEGGLNVSANQATIAACVKSLQSCGIKVALFIDPKKTQVNAAAETGANAIELHTGVYARACDAMAHQKSHGKIKGKNSISPAAARALAALQKQAQLAHGLGLEVHAGHGLNFSSVGQVASIAEIVELNIGHFIVGEAVFEGLATIIQRLQYLIGKARSGKNR